MSILFSDPQCISAAEALRHARTTGTTIAPISVAYGIKGLDAAYAVAAINHQERSHAGARRSRHKPHDGSIKISRLN